MTRTVKSASKAEDSLIKQKKFLDEYSKTLDIKGAALAAGYSKQTGVANALSFLGGKRAKLELQALIEEKAAQFDVRKAFIVSCYLKILNWALDADDYNKPNDPPLALRALEGLTKQLGSGFLALENKGSCNENPEGENHLIINTIKGLDPNKI